MRWFVFKESLITADATNNALTVTNTSHRELIDNFFFEKYQIEANLAETLYLQY
jgi:hypothetical protein